MFFFNIFFTLFLLKVSCSLCRNGIRQDCPIKCLKSTVKFPFSEPKTFLFLIIFWWNLVKLNKLNEYTATSPNFFSEVDKKQKSFGVKKSEFDFWFLTFDRTILQDNISRYSIPAHWYNIHAVNFGYPALAAERKQMFINIFE